MDFDKGIVRCSGICRQTKQIEEALLAVLPNSTVEAANGVIGDVNGNKVYVVKLNDLYLCTVTDYIRGVLFLLDFKPMEHFEIFKSAVSECFGVNRIQIQNRKEEI